MTDVLERLRAALADRYRIERELGQGGMATVYLAEDLKHHRKVAVKVLRPELAATLGPERFFREIEVAAQLQHPHILPLLDSGEADGFLYYVMPFVEGESLRDRLTRQGELPIHEAVKLLAEVADALAYAHAPRRGPPRHQARQRAALGPARAGDRLRRGQGGERGDRAPAAHHRRRRARHAGLHGAGAGGGRPAPRPPGGHLRPRRHGLRAARRPAAVRRALAAGGARGARDPGSRSRSRSAAGRAGRRSPAIVMKCLAKRPADRWQSADELLAQLEPR